MPAVFTDELLDTFLVTGRYDELPQQLVSRFGGLVDRITLTVPNDPAHDAAAAAAIKAIRARSA